MYKGVFDIFSRYWKAYGGIGSLLRSFYLHMAIILLILTTYTWFSPICNAGACTAWWDQSLSILPNLLGFTLGGFAIFVGFGDEKFRALLAQPEQNDSIPTIYVELCATFVHFIVVQILALTIAVVAKSWWFYTPFIDPIRVYLPALNAVAGAFGYGFFLYALMSVLAATMHVFRIASMYSKHQKNQSK
jgi:hypothetical protein